MAQIDQAAHAAADNFPAMLATGDFWQIYGVDIFSFIFSLSLLAGYYFYVGYRTRKNPTYSVQAINNLARAEWVDSIMRDPGKEVLAVQTLRNSTMAATFLGSTAVLLIIGVLTLSAQGDKMEGTWHMLNIAGTTRTEMWLFKLLVILLNLLVAFFSFSMAIRVFNHVGYMINVPMSRKHPKLHPVHVAAHLNRAGYFYSMGMRSYYFCVPLVFWLFGPLFMLLSSVTLVMVLYRLDRAPEFEVEQAEQTDVKHHYNKKISAVKM